MKTDANADRPPPRVGELTQSAEMHVKLTSASPQCSEALFGTTEVTAHYRIEGRDYVVRDGHVLLFKLNV